MRRGYYFDGRNQHALWNDNGYKKISSLFKTCMLLSNGRGFYFAADSLSVNKLVRLL